MLHNPIDKPIELGYGILDSSGTDRHRQPPGQSPGQNPAVGAHTRGLRRDIRRGADIQRVNEEQYAAKVEFYPRFEARQPGLQFFHLSLAFLSYTVEH